jgi:glutamyl-tRNA synthetase/glutamyl-Q tRNA(Asp) synthetase
LIAPGFTTRFAPAPTGYLHLGHAVNAAWTWGLARAFGGRVLLRIEDHDRGRCRAEYETALLDDLDWLGFVPDGTSTDDFRRGAQAQRQSDNRTRYAAHLARLEDAGLAYPCTCARTERYPGTCRGRGIAPDATPARRVVMSPIGAEHFTDLRLGPQSQDPEAQCGDMLIRDRHGNWTYQFAVVVDDYEQGIDLVIRGEDILDSTGRQLRLARLIGRAEPPRFLHHPLVRHPDGRKLSKSSRDTGLHELRAAGLSPQQVLGMAAQLGGLHADSAPVEMAQLADLVRRIACSTDYAVS